MCGRGLRRAKVCKGVISSGTWQQFQTAGFRQIARSGTEAKGTGTSFWQHFVTSPRVWDTPRVSGTWFILKDTLAKYTAVPRGRNFFLTVSSHGIKWTYNSSQQKLREKCPVLLCLPLHQAGLCRLRSWAGNTKKQLFPAALSSKNIQAVESVA